jgi:hypothetical protein
MADYQLGTKDETTYGTRVTVDEFDEFLPGAPIVLDKGYTNSTGLRAGRIVPFVNQGQPYHMGGSGTRTLEVFNLGFEKWLKRMMGAVTVDDDAPVVGADSHIATLADLCGTSFTYQENVIGGACKTTDLAFTWGGGKVASWSLSCEVEGNVTAELEMVFANHTTGTALATASYPTGMEVLSWANAAATIGGTAVPVTSWTLSCNNNLKTDRHYIAGTGATPGTGRSEPVANGPREITFECELDFTDLTQWNRMASLTRANNYAAIEVACQGPIPITGSTYAELNIAIPALRFDDVSIGDMSEEMTMQTVSGEVRDNGSDEPLTITYVTTAAA